MSEMTFRMQDVCCPNCAAKIARSCEKLPGVHSVEHDFATQLLRLHTHGDGDAESLHTKVRQIVQTIEPGADVLLHNPASGNAESHPHSRKDAPEPAPSHDHSAGHAEEEEGISGSQKVRVLRLVAALALLIAGLLPGVPVWLRYALHITGWLTAGYDVLWNAVRTGIKFRTLDENALMTIATLGALAIGETPEALGVMIFYQVGETFQQAAVAKSRASIAQLMDVRPDEARLIDGQVVSPESVPIGARIQVRAGERIPLDGIVRRGSARLDTSALTGEPLPKDALDGTPVLAGYIDLDGTLEIETTKTFSDSAASRILEMVEDAALRKAPTERFITRFARFYTPAVVALAALLAIAPPLVLHQPFSEWLYRGLLFLVVSCPCALVLSVPLSFFAGIGGASRKGILIKGGQTIEALANAHTIAFDKTGTLTMGQFRVSEILPADGVTEEELLRAGALVESESTHPVALAIKSAAQSRVTLTESATVSDHQELPGYGVTARANGQRLAAGNARLMERDGITAPNLRAAGTIVHIARDQAYLGALVITDTVKPDAKQAIARLGAIGIRRMSMLTGDAALSAQKVASEVGLSEVHAELLPGDKLTQVERLHAELPAQKTLLYVGDGLNDAPVLARADVGISMGQMGSDVAIEAADVVLMTDQPDRIADAIELSRKTARIVRQNIVFALCCKSVVLILGALGMTTMWVAVFADVGVALLAVLNAMRAMK